MNLDGLNQQQSDAVTHNDGPCLVLATAGSGKTRVLTMRAARLVEDGCAPNRIFLATFTRKASESMKDRLKPMIGDNADQMWIGTFHGLCLRILRQSYPEPFDVLAPNQAIYVARSILGPRDQHNPLGMDIDTDPFTMISRVSRAKADLITPETAPAWFATIGDIGAVGIQETLEYWSRYEHHKSEKHLMDFDDFLYRTHELFMEYPQKLEHWQQSFDYVMEDEVQDTMIAQHEIAKMLSSGHENYFAVGDINQSIYSFRGSNPDVTVQAFRSDYPGGKIIKLPTNYRSQEGIVSRGAKLIRHNSIDERYSLEPSSNREFACDPEIFLSFTEMHEAEQIVATVAEMNRNGREWSDMAVLYRINAASRSLEDAFVKRDIPYIVNGSKGFYDRSEVRDIVSYFQLIQDPFCDAGDDAVTRVINIPTEWSGMKSHFLGRAFMEELDRIAKHKQIRLMEALDKGIWKTWQRRSINDFKDYLDSVRYSAKTPLEGVKAIRDAGYDQYLLREQGSGEESGEGGRLDILAEIESAAAGFETITEFLNHVTKQRSKAKRLGANKNAVELLTYHRSKGLEWPIVFMCGVAQGMLPHKRSIHFRYLDDGSQEIEPFSIEEERRLCYVGVTRAMDELYVSNLQSYNGSPLERSSFLDEMGFRVPAAVKEGAA